MEFKYRTLYMIHCSKLWKYQTILGLFGENERELLTPEDTQLHLFIKKYKAKSMGY